MEIVDLAYQAWMQEAHDKAYPKKKGNDSELYKELVKMNDLLDRIIELYELQGRISPAG